MTDSSKLINYLHRLDQVCEERNLPKEKICLVGSATLAAHNLRENRDLDIYFDPSVQIDTSRTNTIESSSNRYEHLGISDQDLLTNPRYHEMVNGYKIVRPEIEYVHKQRRGWDKDAGDIELLEQYRQETDDWNLELEAELENYTPGPLHLLQRGFSSIKSSGVRATMNHGVQYLRWHGPLPRRSSYSGQPTTIPGKALWSLRQDGLSTTIQLGIRLIKLKEPTGTFDTYSRLRHKAKLGTLVERQLELRYPTARLITEQYVDCIFSRYDIIIRILAAEALQTGEDIPSIVSKFELKSGVNLQKELTAELKRYDASGTPAKVPVGYDSTILNGNLLAIALLNDYELVPVSVGSSESEKLYKKEWFESDPFTEKELNLLTEEFSNLLYRSNTLFASILWPPAQGHHDEIVSKIRTEKDIHFVEKVKLEDDKFENFVRELYASQASLNSKHVEMKIDEMEPYEKNVTIIGIEVPDPRIRGGFSNEVIQMKERIREHFTPKILTDNPSANLIIHATDNYEHNKKTWKVIDEYR